MEGNTQVNYTIYLNGDNLTRHEKFKHNPSDIKKMYQCHDCSYSTNRSFNLRKHQKSMHNPSEIKKIYECQDCTYSCNRPFNLRRHEKAMHNPLVTLRACMYSLRACMYIQDRIWLGKKLKGGGNIKCVRSAYACMHIQDWIWLSKVT